MKIKIQNLALYSIVIFGLLFSTLFSLLVSDTTFADAKSDREAYCAAKYKGNATKVKKNRTACNHGYKKGLAGSTGNDCGKYARTHSGTYDACKYGKLEGLRVKAASATPANVAANAKNDCAGVATYFDFGCTGTDVKKGGDQNPIVAMMITALSWFTGLVALATVGGIVYGGILYASAQDNTGQTQKGIMYVVNSSMGLILWMSAYALINFIVPGGLFN